MNKIWSYSIIGFLFLLIILAYTEYHAELTDRSDESHRQADPHEASYVPGLKTLIIAPHPDDETLGGAGAMLKSAAAGRNVKVLLMTSGDGYKKAAANYFGISEPGPKEFLRLGNLRHQESLRAVRHLGVHDRNDVVFLNYPDGGVNGLWEANWDCTNLHRGLNGGTHAPYDYSYEKNAPYCGANVVKNLEQILHDFQPTDIIYPDPNDQHHDHWATSAFIKYVLAKNRYAVNEWTYLVHRTDFPKPLVHDGDLPLKPPLVMEDLDAQWYEVAMNAEARKRKLAAVREYATQTKRMDLFLEAFVRKNDLLETYPDPILKMVQGPVSSAEIPSLFPDAYADTLQDKLEPFADIVSIGGGLDRERFYVSIELNAAIHPGIAYDIRLRIFRPQAIDRFDLSFQQGQLRAVKHADNSLELTPDISIEANENRIMLSFPAEIVQGAEGFMISADSISQGKRIDKTAWRLIRMPFAS
ncbi:PIG-L deacetylase family protein [Ferviditalea candida]|uniref:PIG-L family deacetylase n=1 Tax=Ferviditalea candida TaxID=3108399 RepID=A0ABU5ZC55_9BACL|nr:PIG-L family deacetylase [Paenibacillaceae bacterium T2]